MFSRKRRYIFFQLKFFQEDSSELTDKYAFESILCHRNMNPGCGNFIAIVKKRNKLFYCDDSTILDGFPQKSATCCSIENRERIITRSNQHLKMEQQKGEIVIQKNPYLK